MTHPKWTQFCNHPHVQGRQNYPVTIDELQSVVIPNLLGIVNMHKGSMTDVLNTQQQHVANQQAKTLRSQFWASRKKADTAVFENTGNNTGVVNNTIGAMQHPLRGVTLTPPRSSRAWFHRQQMSRLVPASLVGQLPWSPS